MRVLRGFSVAEIMATITIMGILAVIIAPQYWNLQDRDKYRSGSQEFFDTIIDARNAAVTNKKCNNSGTSLTSLRWGVVMEPIPASSGGGYRYVLKCYHSAGETVERAVVESQNTKIDKIDFNGTDNPSEMTTDFPDNIFFGFLTGGGQGKLEYTLGANPVQKANAVLIVLGYTKGIFSQTLCFNRVAGFPTINKSGETCPSY